jgi:AcrR family transcriptional regulator
MTLTSGERPVDALEMGRGERTRALILEASRQLFLQRGYAGTPINAITEACGISRAGFYTYFKDKHDVFNTLGETAYHDQLAVIARLESLPRPYQLADVRRWVGEYFAYMDRHGAFVLSAYSSAPDDEAFRRSRNRMVTRSAWRLGQALGGNGTHSPEVLGAAVTGLLDRAWHAVQSQWVAADQDEMIAVVADMISAMIGHWSEC